MEFYKTKITLEIEVQTQFGPLDAVNHLRHCMSDAVKTASITSLSSDYTPITKKDINRQVLEEKIPFKLK